MNYRRIQELYKKKIRGWSIKKKLLYRLEKSKRKTKNNDQIKQICEIRKLGFQSNLQTMIPSDDLDPKYVFVVIKQLQSLSTGGRRKPWLHIHFPYASNLQIPLNHTSTHKGLVVLRLIKSPHQRPYLQDLKRNRKRAQQFLISEIQSRDRSDDPSLSPNGNLNKKEIRGEVSRGEPELWFAWWERSCTDSPSAHACDASERTPIPSSYTRSSSCRRPTTRRRRH